MEEHKSKDFYSCMLYALKPIFNVLGTLCTTAPEYAYTLSGDSVAACSAAAGQREILNKKALG